MKTKKIDLGMVMIVAILAVVVVLSGVLIWAAMQEDKACTAAGGHQYSSTSTGYAINPATGKGGVVTTTSTTCLTSDGRIIENP